MKHYQEEFISSILFFSITILVILLILIKNTIREKNRVAKTDKELIKKKENEQREQKRLELIERNKLSNIQDEKRNKAKYQEFIESLKKEFEILFKKEFQEFINIHESFFERKLYLHNQLFDYYNMLPNIYEEEIVNIYIKNCPLECHKNLTQSYYVELNRIKAYFELRKAKLKEVKYFGDTDDSLEISSYPSLIIMPLNYLFSLNIYNCQENNAFLLSFYSHYGSGGAKLFKIRENEFRNFVVLKPNVDISYFLELTRNITMIDKVVKLGLVQSFNNYTYYWLQRNVILFNEGFGMESIGQFFVPDISNPNAPRMLNYCYNSISDYRINIKKIQNNILLSKSEKEQLFLKEKVILYNSGINDNYKNDTIENNQKNFMKTTVFIVKPNFNVFQNYIERQEVMSL